MFERYTENARRTIFFARWEANQCGAQVIESGHLALALFRDSWVREELLENVEEAQVRNDILGIPPQPRKENNTVDLPLSDESKRVLSHAVAEAEMLSDRHIGNEHLLLGLLIEEPSDTAQALQRRGILLETLRARIRSIPAEQRKYHSGEQTVRYRAAGIPDGYRFSGLLFNPASETIVLGLQSVEETFRRRLFMRHKDTDVYEQIGTPADNISYESPVSCEKHPAVVFNALTYTKGGGDWVCVYAFDLRRKELSICVSKENLVVPAPYSDGWIAKVVGLSDDTRVAYVKAGLEMRYEHGANMDYYVATLDLQSGKLDLITRLKNTFF